MSQEIGVAVAGCGYWGPNLVRNFHSLPNCRVKALCDVDAAQLDRVARLYPDIDAQTDLGRILCDEAIHAVAIATPVHSHFRLAKQSLLAGKHVLLEKPMAASAAQCRELLHLATQRRLTLMVGHTFIFSAAVRAIRDLVKSGELGEVRYVSAQRLNLGRLQKDINACWDLAPHDLSILLYVLGRDPVSVNCQGKAYFRPGIEEVTHLTLNFPGNLLAMVHSSWLDPNKVRRMTIVGSRRMLVYDDTEPQAKIRIHDKCVEVPSTHHAAGEAQYSYHLGDTVVPQLHHVEPLRVQAEIFLESIRTGSKAETGGLEGLRVVEILEAASASLRDGGSTVPVGAFPAGRTGIPA
jgi:predicted dehydrogenase